VNTSRDTITCERVVLASRRSSIDCSLGRQAVLSPLTQTQVYATSGLASLSVDVA